MKKYLLIFIILPLLTFAQKKDVVYYKLANLSCECSNKLNANEITQTALGLCIFEAISKLSEKEKKIVGFTGENKMDAIEPIAENVGMEMATICPTIFTKIIKENQFNANNETADEASLSTTGLFDSASSSEYFLIYLLDDKNEKKEFVWLNSFEGDSLFIKNKVTKGDKLEISYKAIELYNSKTNGYSTYNTIVSIKLL